MLICLALKGIHGHEIYSTELSKNESQQLFLS